LWLCPAPRSTLFPYTTLFRSLGSRISIGEVSIPLPWTILFAGVFNWIITKTALLWTPNKAIAAIPTWIWLAGFIALLMWPALSRSEEHTSELQSRFDLVCRLL